MMLSACSNVSDLRFVGDADCGVQDDLSFSEDSSADSNNSSSEGQNDSDLAPNDVVEIRSKPRILEKRVSFPTDESLLVRNLEPSLPEPTPEYVLPPAVGINLSTIYTTSCQKNNTTPVELILEQLKTLDLTSPRSASLTLRGLSLESTDCESLEDVLKNVPLKLLDLGASHCNDDGLIALFDMIEFYEAATHVSIAANKNMTNRGWQACCRMIKRTECLEWLDAAQVVLSEHSATLLARALRSNSRLRVLLLNGCGLTGRPLAIIASSLKMNRNLRELHLAENRLTAFDALQLGMLLSGNKSLQLLDLGNNDIGDKGMAYLCDALLDNTGLNTLVVWNNNVTRESSSGIARLLAGNQTLQTLNLGYNSLGDEGLIGMIPSGLERNRTLLHLGLQETGLTCTGVISLAESLATGTGLQRVDLRKNNFQLAGLMALAAALKLCPTVTRVDLLNATPPSIEIISEFRRLEKEIADCCASHDMTPEEKEESNEQLTPAKDTLIAKAEEIISRKISLTCFTPICETKLILPLIRTDEENEDGVRMPRRLRSPLPSPQPSPQPSPCSSRFKVTRVDAPQDDSPFPSPGRSPLPSPRSRFTVIPVATALALDGASLPSSQPDSLPSESKPPPCEPQAEVASPPDVGGGREPANLIRSSPSKVIVGFDVAST